MSDPPVAAHDQTASHHYLLHYPAHPARTSDPHYPAFNAFHQKNRKTARCRVGVRIGFDECLDAQGKPAPAPADPNAEQAGLELHHAVVEFSLQNGVDAAALAVDFPAIHPDATPEEVDAWIETEPNFWWLCAYHHRGSSGAHTAAFADWEASQYVKGLIGKG
jgi:hypothetical protein